MKPKLHAILYTFLGLALAVTLLIALDQGVSAQAAQQALEDTFTQRVLEAQEHLQAIQTKLSKAPVIRQRQEQARLLMEISTQAGETAAALSALPLSHVAMQDTVKFCNQLSEYTLTQALLVVETGTLTDDALATLDALQSQCAQLLGQFALARDEMLRQSLRLVGSENVYYAAASAELRPLEQVADPDHGMDYPAMVYDGAFSDARHNGTPKALSAISVTEEEAVAIAARFVGQTRVQSAQQAARTEGALPCYGVQLTLTDGVVLTAEVTRQGGRVLWMVPEHAEFAQRKSLEECTEAARAFLLQNGLGPAERNHFQVYGGMAVLNFVAVQDGVLLYPDLVKVQVRMDTGEVVGVEANNYLMNHVERADLKPALTAAQARERVSARLSVTDARLCVIPYRDEERLCYEVAGQYAGGDYRVYIDARSGEELQVLQMLQTGDGLSAA